MVEIIFWWDWKGRMEEREKKPKNENQKPNKSEFERSKSQFMLVQCAFDT